MSDVAALEGRVTRLESAVTDGFKRVESLLRQEISDLKDEQIKDLKETNKRLADDQRRLWESVGDLQRREHIRLGSSKFLSAVGHFLSAGMGGLVTWVATYLSFGGKPPHP